MVPHKVSFPLLERIEIQYAALDKWKNIFGSLTSLKHVVLKAVRIYPAVTPFPLSASEQLETLDLTESPDMEERVADWLDENCTSLPGLRKLIVGTISVEALLSMLSNCPKLVKLGVIPEQEVHMPSDMTDEHLEAISRLAPPSFQTLSLHWVNYSKLGLDAFIASCPASITSLDISRSTGLTPTQLRALFRISTLRELFLKCVAVLPEHWKEINAIAANEKPEGLILHVDFDMPENEDDDI